MDIHPKENVLLFDSLGLDGFKFFNVDSDERIIDELLYNFKKCKVSLTDQYLTLYTKNFSIDSQKNLYTAKKNS